MWEIVLAISIYGYTTYQKISKLFDSCQSYSNQSWHILTKKVQNPRHGNMYKMIKKMAKNNCCSYKFSLISMLHILQFCNICIFVNQMTSRIFKLTVLLFYCVLLLFFLTSNLSKLLCTKLLSQSVYQLRSPTQQLQTDNHILSISHIHVRTYIHTYADRYIHRQRYRCLLTFLGLKVE